MVKKLILFWFSILIVSCSENNTKTQDLRQNTYSDTSQQNERTILKNLFSMWQHEKINEGKMWAQDSCFSSWFENHVYEKPVSEWGFSDNTEFKFSYADLNNDGKTDQMVTFNPEQCAGGNGSMWVQLKVFTISEGNNYNSFSSLDKTLFGHEGIWHYDSIAINKVYGTYYEFLEEDERCCPSIQYLFEVDYKTSKTKITDTLDVEY